MTHADSATVVLSEYARRLDAFGFSGQLVVEEDGRILLSRPVGVADERTNTPMNEETLFGLGSITKTFTAAAILRLQTLGKLNVDDPIGKHLPGVPPDKAAITIDELLSHRGGLRLDADLPDEASREEVVRLILAQPLGWAPGEGFHYSNIGFDLLGAIVEAASGTDYDSFVRQQFLDRAGMKHTGRAGVPRLAKFPAARGTNEWGEATALREWPPAWHGTGAGRMVSNARDLLRWGHALRDGLVLTPAERDLMFARHADEPNGASYGYGMQRVENWFFHGGDVPGYRGELRIEPAHNRFIVVLTNQDLWEEGYQRHVIANELSSLSGGGALETPPAAHIEAAPAGTWVLPGGGRITLSARDGRTRLWARGQDAIDLFEPDPRDTLAVRSEATRMTRVLLAAALARDSTTARGLLSDAEYAYGWAFLHQGIDRIVERVGAIDSVVTLGSVTSPFAFQGTRTYFTIHVGAGARGGYLAWQGGKLDDVTLGDERPAPVILPAAPLTSGGWAAYDLIRERAIPFTLEGNVLKIGDVSAIRR